MPADRRTEQRIGQSASIVAETELENFDRRSSVEGSEPRTVNSPVMLAPACYNAVLGTTVSKRRITTGGVARAYSP